VRRALRALGVLAVLTPLAAAAEPCTDVPGIPGLRCRVAELGAQTLLVDDRLAKAVSKTRRVFGRGRDACLAGRNQRARRQLGKMRKPLAKTARMLERAAERTSLPGVHHEELRALLRLVDALRRATVARLDRLPCPDLVEVLEPRHHAAAGDAFFLAFTLAAAVDARAVNAALVPDASPEAPIPVALDQISRGHGWATVACPAPGTYRLQVRARDRDVIDTDEVTVHCGAQTRVLGGDVETLIDHDASPDTLSLRPVRPLAGGTTYAVVVTGGLRGLRRTHAVPSPAFRDAAGLPPAPPGIEVHWQPDPDDPRNPFPDDRLRRADGTVRIPPGFTGRALAPDARLDGARAFLDRLDADSETHAGFSASTAVALAFSEAILLENATPEHVRLIEVRDPAAVADDPAALVAALQRERGLAPGDVALATTFTTEALPAALATVREQIVARAQITPPVADFLTDPNPGDQRLFGVFVPGDPEFAGFFGGTPPPTAALVARGLFSSPDYRDAASGTFPDRFLDGSEIPPHVPIDFLVVLPTGAMPAGGHPTVILQHGFSGDTSFVTDHAGEFTATGLAVIGIPAPHHGSRGNIFEFLVFEDFNAFGDNFRQSTVDLLQLVRLLETGLDVDGDTVPDLNPAGLGYLGVSLGGVIGATLASMEPAVIAAVLNVPGGRLAQFAGSVSSLATPFLVSFAGEAGIPAQTCGGRPDAAACTSDDDCAGDGACVFGDDFTAMLAAALPNFQWQLDPGDGINYVRHLRIDPLLGPPRAVLVQEGVGDHVVANPLTEALVRGLGLPNDRPDQSPQGVAGLWRFDVNEGVPEEEQVEPHGIFTALPEVRYQAITFLESAGTRLVEPVLPEEQ